MLLIDLPDCVLEQIFEYLSYDEIAKKRLVCKRVDKICQHLLNIGFNKMVKLHNKELKHIKSLLPRRESERRNHPLSRHTDILTSIETRISMLSMTYTKYIELNLCCFIPGKVIDEVFRVLNLIKTTTKSLRAHEVLQELRDISSMAIEHFDEKIAHSFKKYFMNMNSSQKYSNNLPSSPTRDDSLNMIRTRPSSSMNVEPISTHEFLIRCPEARSNRLLIKKLEGKYCMTVKKLVNHLSLQFNRMVHIQNKQTKQLRENAVLMSKMNSQIVELKRRLEEADAKNREISANMIQITGEPITTANSGNAVGVVPNNVVINMSSMNSNDISTPKCSSPSPEKTSPVCNIKPRSASIILKRRTTESFSSSSNESSEIFINNISKKPKLDS